MSEKKKKKGKSGFSGLVILSFIFIISGIALLLYFKPMGDKAAFDDLTYKNSELGYKYKILSKGEGPTPKDGDLVKFRFTYRKKKAKKPFFDSNPTGSNNDGFPIFFNEKLLKDNSGIVSILHVFLSKVGKKGQVRGIIKPVDLFKSKEGDLKDLMKDFLEKNSLKADSDLVVEVTINEILNKEEQEKKRLEEEQELEEIHKNQLEEIEKHVNAVHKKDFSQGYRKAKTSSGATYILKYPRQKGLETKGRESIGIKYTLRIMGGDIIGKEDSIMTLQLPFGEGRYIKGLEEVVSLLRKGEKVRVYIPSKAAYGDREDHIIPKNSILDFEVTIISVYPEQI